ncbi:MAG TPA: protein kinase [Anaeromyxobacteraceae bacterium]|nr:protein kinase [Anaeromyxobacteraceae bacterium]
MNPLPAPGPSPEAAPADGTAPSDGGVAPGALTELLEELAAAPLGDGDAAWMQWLTPGAVAGRFEMVREVGRGAFGVVWEARDTELGRSVAFKAVSSGDKARLREEHLRREAEAAARLSHPNIVTLHDLGRTPQGPFLVMEFLRGETLAERLRRERIQIRDVLHIGYEVAKGLAHAHGLGVMHRDLKPANVFLCADGQVKVLDFGMAHVFGSKRRRGGTPGYMAPEQREGRPEEHQADVYALGVILFEMLEGRLPPPLDGTGAGTPRRPRVPEAPALGGLVERMLARGPAERPPDGRAVADALLVIGRGLDAHPGDDRRGERTSDRTRRRVLFSGIALAAIVALLVGAVVNRRVGALRMGDEHVMVAVADFANHTDDPDLDGLSGLLMTSLEQSSRLRVLTRSRVLDLLRDSGGGDSPRIDEGAVRAAGRLAGVRAVLLASIQRLGGVYVAELRAIDPERDEHLFALRESAATKSEVLALVDRLADGVRQALEGSRAQEVKVANAVTGNLEAYRHYFRGKDLAARGNIEEAIGEYELAGAIEPGFSLAHLEVAWLGYLSGDRTRRSARATIREAARNGANAPDKEARLMSLLGAFFDGRFATARREAMQLVERYPEDRDVATVTAEILDWSGEGEGILPYFRKAFRLAPDWDVLRIEEVRSLGLAGRGTEALERAQAAARERDTPLARVALGLARYGVGDIEGGVTTIRGAGATDTLAPCYLANGLAYLGRIDEALAALAPLAEHKPLRHDMVAGQVLAYAGRLRDGVAALDAGAKHPGDDVAFNRQVTAWYLAAAGDLDGARRMANQGDFFTVLDGPMLAAIGDGPRLDTLLAEVGPEAGFHGRFLRAVAAYRKGDLDRALADLRELDVGTGASFVPYYRGAAAAEAGLDAETVDAFRRFLKPLLVGAAAYEAPWLVARARYLMARSLDRLGRRREAASVLDLQLRRWSHADPDLPLLGDMKRLRAKLAGSESARRSHLFQATVSTETSASTAGPKVPGGAEPPLPAP